MAPDVSVIIVSYNCAAELCACLHSIVRETTRHSVEIIVVDNNSCDGTLAMLSRDFPQVQVVWLHSNIGFAAANNQGLAVATGRYILYLNPDTIILDGAVDVMLDYLEQTPTAGLTGPRTFNADGRTIQTTVYGARSLGTVFHCYIPLFKHLPLFRPTRVDVYRPDHTCAVDTVRGCCMLLPASLLRTLGGMNEEYFMYEEDYDLCGRVRACGYDVIYLYEACIIHLEGKSSQSSVALREQLAVAMLRSMMLHFRILYPSSLHRLRLILLAGSLWRYALFLALCTVPSRSHSARIGRREQAARLRWLIREYR